MITTLKLMIVAGVRPGIVDKRAPGSAAAGWAGQF